MIRTTINNHSLKLYDCIDEMPIVNYQKYNKYLLIDSNIGSDLNDYNQRTARMLQQMQKGKLEELRQEIINQRQLMFMINQEISPKYLAFAALIAEFDGKPVTDLSDDNLKAILSKIRNVKHSWLDKILADIKKKLSTELNLYYPALFTSAKEKEAYYKLRERTILELEGIIADKDNTNKIAEIDAYFLGLLKPLSFLGTNSAEIKYDKAFENSCILIKFKLHLNAKKLTVLEYYNAIETLNKMEKAQKKLNKK